MKPESKYESVPYGFAYYLNKNASTLRNVYAISFRNNLHRNRLFSIITPDCTTPQTDGCPFYKADQKDRYALGITHLLDNPSNGQ